MARSTVLAQNDTLVDDVTKDVIDQRNGTCSQQRASDVSTTSS